MIRVSPTISFAPWTKRSRYYPKVLALDRLAVRQRFEQRFSATRMTKDYVHVYRSLLKRPSLSERSAVIPKLEPDLEKSMT